VLVGFTATPSTQTKYGELPAHDFKGSCASRSRESPQPAGWNGEECSIPRREHVSYGPLGRAELIIVDDCPDARIAWRLADHSSPTAKLQRDLGDLDREGYRDGDRSAIPQSDGQRHEHPVGTDARRLSLRLSKPSRGTLPANLRREFHRNPYACAKISHAVCNLGVCQHICHREINPILSLPQVVSVRSDLQAQRPTRSRSRVAGMARKAHPTCTAAPKV